MNIKELKEKIDSLDPKVHGALLKTLTDEYDRLAATEGKTQGPEETSQDTFLAMFEKVVNELNEMYVEGVTEYIQRQHPRLQAEIDETEDKLNEVWSAGLGAKAGIEEFRQVLERWHRLHLQCIEIYSDEGENKMKHKRKTSLVKVEANQKERFEIDRS